MKSKNLNTSKVGEEFNNSSSTSITYQGNVTVKYVKNGKVIKKRKQHNAGTAELFDVILTALSGSLHTNRIPYYLLAFTTEGKSALYKAAAKSSVIKVDNQTNSITYTFTLPYAMFNLSTLSGGKNINTLRLYGESHIVHDNLENSTNPLAAVELVEDEQISYNDLIFGVSVIIEWKMTFSNATSEVIKEEN